MTVHSVISQAGLMQLDGQTSTHSGESLWPSHSVQVPTSILKKILPVLIDLVGQTGLQSPQAVHMSGSIFIAMRVLLEFFQSSAAPMRLARNEMGRRGGLAIGSMK